MCACGLSCPLIAKLPGGAFVAFVGPTESTSFWTKVALLAIPSPLIGSTAKLPPPIIGYIHVFAKGSTLRWAGPAPCELTTLSNVRSPFARLIDSALTEPLGGDVVKLEISFTAYRYFPFGWIAIQDGDGIAAADFELGKISRREIED